MVASGFSITVVFDRRSAVRHVLAFDRRQDVAHGALVVLGEVDLGPRITAGADRVQRPERAKSRERARRPVAQAAGGDALIEQRRQQLGAVARRTSRRRRSRRRPRPAAASWQISSDSAAADLDLHLLVAERLRVVVLIGNEQRVLVAGGHEVRQHLRMEEHVTIHDNEAVI